MIMAGSSHIIPCRKWAILRSAVLLLLCVFPGSGVWAHNGVDHGDGDYDYGHAPSTGPGTPCATSVVLAGATITLNSVTWDNAKKFTTFTYTYNPNANTYTVNEVSLLASCITLLCSSMQLRSHAICVAAHTYVRTCILYSFMCICMHRCTCTPCTHLCTCT